LRKPWTGSVNRPILNDEKAGRFGEALGQSMRLQVLIVLFGLCDSDRIESNVVRRKKKG
jgi:hypothetical protein